MVNESQYLQLLLSILSQEPVYINRLFLQKLENKFKNHVEYSELYIGNGVYSSRINESTINVSKFSANFTRDFNQAINIWFQNEDNWKSIVELLLNAAFAKDSNSTTEFMNIVTAAESWSRINTDSYDSHSIEMFDRLSANIVSPDISKWVSAKKKGLTLLSLPKRLRTFCDNDLLHLILDKKKFIGKCVSQRNYIAHNLLEHKEPSSYIEIYIMSLVLTLLLSQRILEQLKIPDAKIISILSRSNTYEYLLNVREINPEVNM